MNTPNIITNKTKAPWTITRNLALDDGTELDGFRITVDTADREGGYSIQDWTAHIADDARWADLTEEQADEVLEIVCDLLSDLEHRLQNGGTVLADGDADGDHEARWDAEARLLEDALSDLKSLDANGWSTVTDGSLDDLTTAERLEVVREAIRSIEEQA